ncbi:acylphosphatase [Devosia pacifica]|uniref:acylphosphatase n=1 Tax=Devosia pacifica TaxID=1335967 RepID=A0A918VUV4_9HYPH|nr:acylphosphatase [Devosia pacifica]GHA27891.1 acylphosphatase [Devosia pacifica]
MLTAHVFISGRVQGVGYRAWINEEALSRGLDGWVRNLADGRVEAMFHGDREKVETMVDDCRIGPHAAGVSGVVNQCWSGDIPTGFSVRPTA